MLDQTIQQNLSQVRSPAGGVVESVATVAQTVAEGEVIVTIARPDQMLVVWTDLSGNWRKLREDSEVPVFVQSPGGERAALARVDDIDTVPGGAKIEAVIANPRRGDGRMWREGWSARIGSPLAATAGKAPGPLWVNLPEAVLGDSAGGSVDEILDVAVLVPQSAGSVHHIEWRRVRSESLGNGTVRVTGLAPGERVALHPEALDQSVKSIRIVDNI